MLAITQTDNFLVTVDRFSGKLGLLSAAIDRVMERFTPINQVVGCGGGVLCGARCEWTEMCCCGLSNSRKQRFETRAPDWPYCGTSFEYECSPGCPSACPSCGGC
jgi:hypothetical protein